MDFSTKVSPSPSLTPMSTTLERLKGRRLGASGNLIVGANRQGRRSASSIGAKEQYGLVGSIRNVTPNGNGDGPTLKRSSSAPGEKAFQKK